MIRIDIAGHKYHLPQDWHEISIAKGIELDGIIKDMPGNLRELDDDLHTGKKMEWSTVGIGVDDIYINWPKWYGRVISCIGGVHDEVMERTLADQRSMIYKTYLERFIIGMVYMPYDFVPDRRNYFEHEGIRYYFPFSGKNGLGLDVPGRWMDTIEFTESADLLMTAKKLEDGIVSVVPKLIAILCRPMGEKYDEATVLSRADKFGSLGMDIAWKVLFFSMDCTTLLLNDLESYFSQEKISGLEELSLNRVLRHSDGMAV